MLQYFMEDYGVVYISLSWLVVELKAKLKFNL